ncbi:MAG: hypothetical protein R3E44_03500 [Paracoccaceae bacterium]
MTRRLPSRARVLGILLAGYAGLSAPAFGETLRLRAGEHPDFSRLVLDLDPKAGWRLGRTDDGYELRLTGLAADIDSSGVFEKIPRSRIADVTLRDNPPGLAISLGCDCHATAFVTSAGSLVIDVVDGHPSPDSPFEAAPASSPEDEGGIATPTLPAAQPTFRPAPTSDPRLAFFWRGAAPRESAQAATPNKRPKLRHDQSLSEPAQTRARPLTPRMPDPRVHQAEEELLQQFSRATAQGLVTVRPGTEITIGESEDTVRTEPVIETDHDAAQPTATMPEQGAPIHAETAIDRDMLLPESRNPVTADGATCLPDESFALSSWGDERPASVQIAERRGALVGEFDRVSAVAVTDLARLYLFLGFGAEARAVLTELAITGEDHALLLDLAAILDGWPATAPGDLAPMADCDTAAALWALLSGPEAPRDAIIDGAAVIRTFSGLPAHLRRHLGPIVTERLLALGHQDAARAVRDAIARAPGEVGAALDLVDARLGFAAGHADAGEASLADLAKGNGPLTPEALILTIGSRIDRGMPVEPDLAESAGALAFELKDARLGPDLARAHALALASGGDFAAAFDAYRRALRITSDDLADETLQSLFRMLAEAADEATFLSHYFDLRSDLADTEPDTLLRLALAARLVDAGLSASARDTLKGEAALTENGRRLMARAEMTDFNPQKALDQIDGLRDAEAESIRAAAHSMAGNHAAAASTLEALGQTGESAKEAWRAGDWVWAAQGGAPLMTNALNQLGLTSQPTDRQQVPASEGPPGEQTSLGNARSLVERSRVTRSAIETLLSATEAVPGG